MNPIRKNLKNPFEIRPGELWANRAYLWRIIEQKIELIQLSNSNDILILVGDYGSGTTHTLLQIRKTLEEKSSIASYIRVPIQADIESLYRMFLDDLRPSEKEKVFEGLLQDIRLYSPDLEERVVEFSKRERLRRADVRGALEKFIHRNRLTQLDRSILDEYGIPVYASRLSVLDLWMKSIATLSKERPVFILFDELDFADINILNHIRRIFDDITYGLNIIIGFKGTPHQVEMKLEEAFRSRLTLRPIYLYPLSKDEAKEFLYDLLKIQGFSNPESIYNPFDAESIDTITDLMCPCTPRDLLRTCALLFEEMRRVKDSCITNDFVLSALRKFGSVQIIKNEQMKGKLKTDEKPRSRNKQSKNDVPSTNANQTVSS